MEATKFLEMIGTTSGAAREMLIRDMLLQGNIPSFLYQLCPITVTDASSTNTLTYMVMPDYLCVGDDDDYIHMPMTPTTATLFMNKHDFMLPTKKMVDDIWMNADTKIRPITWTEMYGKSEKKYGRGSSVCYEEHSRRIQRLANLSETPQNPTSTTDPLPPHPLRAGHKKDVVLANALTESRFKGNVAIYGWFNTDGTVIQGLNPKSHTVSYVDYSHGLRMVSNNCTLNGQPTKLLSILTHPTMYSLVNDTAPLRFIRY